MSVGVYRVNEMKIEHENVQSFNLWHNNELASYLGINEDCVTEIPISLIEDAIEDLELDEDIVESLKADIEFAKSKGQTYVSYIAI